VGTSVHQAPDTTHIQYQYVTSILCHFFMLTAVLVAVLCYWLNKAFWLKGWADMKQVVVGESTFYSSEEGQVSHEV